MNKNVFHYDLHTKKGGKYLSKTFYHRRFKIFIEKFSENAFRHFSDNTFLLVNVTGYTLLLHSRKKRTRTVKGKKFFVSIVIQQQPRYINIQINWYHFVGSGDKICFFLFEEYGFVYNKSTPQGLHVYNSTRYIISMVKIQIEYKCKKLIESKKCGKKFQFDSTILKKIKLQYWLRHSNELIQVFRTFFQLDFFLCIFF